MKKGFKGTCYRVSDGNLCTILFGNATTPQKAQAGKNEDFTTQKDTIGNR